MITKHINEKMKWKAKETQEDIRVKMIKHQIEITEQKS